MVHIGELQLRWRLAIAFLELWFKMKSLELWLKMEGKHVVIPGCGLVILETGVSVQVVVCMDGLHLIGQS